MEAPSCPGYPRPPDSRMEGQGHAVCAHTGLQHWSWMVHIDENTHDVARAPFPYTVKTVDKTTSMSPYFPHGLNVCAP